MAMESEMKVVSWCGIITYEVVGEQKLFLHGRGVGGANCKFTFELLPCYITQATIA